MRLYVLQFRGVDIRDCDIAELARLQEEADFCRSLRVGVMAESIAKALGG